MVRFTGATLEVDWYAADSTCGPFTLEPRVVDSCGASYLVNRFTQDRVM